MDNTFELILVILGTLGVAFLFFYFFNRKSQLNNAARLQQSNKKSAISDSEKAEFQKALKSFENEKNQFRQEEKRLRTDMKSLKSDLTRQEQSLNDREQSILQRSSLLDDRFKKLEEKEIYLEKTLLEISAQKEDLKTKLNEVANLTREEAQKKVINEVELEMKGWISKRIREGEKLIDSTVDEHAQQILIDAMYQASTDYISDVSITKFQLDNEDMKGKIIGKEGRNIKAFERLTGVEIILDDDAAITISCFDPIRREVAAISIARLLKGGRLHPGTIEETVEKVKKDLLKIIKKEGEDLAFKAGFSDLPEEIVKLLGKFKYRFSYGQNLARHTLEMVQISEAIAKELGLNVQAVKLAALLHDIGKVVITDSLGTDERQHHHISAEIAKKYKMSDMVVNAIEAHHEDIPSRYMESEVIKIADSISGSRIGARRENYEEYIKRIKALEDIAKSKVGVREAYAIYAGREIRILVEPSKLSDDDIVILSHDIAKEIHDTQNYPGVIKVSVIRETRASANA